jgi:hypothetical protein
MKTLQDFKDELNKFISAIEENYREMFKTFEEAGELDLTEDENTEALTYMTIRVAKMQQVINELEE